MPLFDYTGQLRSGALFQGTLEAESQQHAQAMLADMSVRVTSLRPARQTAYVAALSVDELLFFNEQLAALAKSALPLQEGLRNLAADVGSRKLKRLLLDLSADLAAGTPLEQAIEKQKRRFPPRYADVIKAGLRTGDLGGALYGVTAHLQLKSNFRRALLELAAYPAVVLTLAMVIVSFFMRFVMPELLAIIDDFRREYNVAQPDIVTWTYAVTRHWSTIEIGAVSVAAALVLVFVITLLPAGGRLRERLLRRIPGCAQVYWSSVLTRFTHTSALAAHAATPLPELIAASGAASGSPALSRATRRLAGRIEEGQPLERAAENEKDIPALWTCVVATASQRGGLAAALQELARTYELRAQQWVSTVRTILGPLLLLAVGTMLGAMISMVFFILSTLSRMISAV